MRKQLNKVFSSLAKATQAPAKHWKIEAGHVVVPSFIDECIQYYTLENLFDSYAQRGLAAIDSFEEYNMRCSRKHLIDVVSKLEQIQGRQTYGVQDLIEEKQIVSDLKERLLFPLPPMDLIYKLASVAYWDENESPYSYDENYNKKKIEKWKQSKTIDDFFLTVPLGNIVNLGDLSKFDLKDYFQTLEQIDQIHKQRLSLHN